MKTRSDVNPPAGREKADHPADFKLAGLDKRFSHLYKTPDLYIEVYHADDHLPIEKAAAVYPSEMY